MTRGALVGGGMFMPRGLLTRAALIMAALALFHLLGWRDDTRIISGTSPPRDLASQLAALRGVVYGLTYFAAVVLAPILLIAASLLALAGRKRRGAP
jgi:hypothetical protein